MGREGAARGRGHEAGARVLTRLPAIVVRSRLLASLVGMSVLAHAQAGKAEPSVAIVPLGFEATEFRGPGSRVAATIASTDAFRESRPPLGGPLVVVWGRGAGAVLSLADGELKLRPARKGVGDFAALETARGAIPSARAEAAGPLGVSLEDPTRDYPHEALGSPIHARTLVITERDAAPPPSTEPRRIGANRTRIEAGPGAVFEDREPRLVDLDGDGTSEVLVIRSDRARGSSLAIAARRDGGWRIVAETPPDGEPFRWLNPVAPPASGLPKGSVLLVRRPHLDGILQLWRWTGERLDRVAERPGYANHAFGSPAQDLAASYPSGDGTARLAIPTLDRREIAILALPGLEELARIPLPARAATGVAALGEGRAVHILVGLENGQVADLRP